MTASTLADLRAAAEQLERETRDAPTWNATRHDAKNAAWIAYRAAARASDLPRPTPARGVQFDSAVWIDYSYAPARCQITRIALCIARPRSKAV